MPHLDKKDLHQAENVAKRPPYGEKEAKNSNIEIIFFQGGRATTLPPPPASTHINRGKTKECTDLKIAGKIKSLGNSPYIVTIVTVMVKHLLVSHVNKMICHYYI